MLNGKDMIIILIVGLIKRLCKKRVNTLLSRLEVFEGILMLKLLFQIMQQKLI